MDASTKKLNKQASLTGIFASRNDAKDIYFDLLNKGYGKEDIKLLLSEKNLVEDSAEQETTMKKEKNEALSHTIGTVAGIVVGICLAGALVIAGFSYTGLLGAGVAGIIGVVIGLLMIPGTSKNNLRIVETKADDSIIIRVNTKNADDAKYLEDAWRTLKGSQTIIAIR